MLATAGQSAALLSNQRASPKTSHQSATKPTGECVTELVLVMSATPVPHPRRTDADIISSHHHCFSRSLALIACALTNNKKNTHTEISRDAPRRFMTHIFCAFFSRTNALRDVSFILAVNWRCVTTSAENPPPVAVVQVREELLSTITRARARSCACVCFAPMIVAFFFHRVL